MKMTTHVPTPLLNWFPRKCTAIKKKKNQKNQKNSEEYILAQGILYKGLKIIL